MMNLIAFRNIALAVIMEEEDFLSKFGKGIFEVPELAIAYMIGRKVQELNPSYHWHRETKLDGYSGIADLVIDKTLVEFKLRDTGDKYLRDIKRLNEFNSELIDQKVFFLLSDVFERDLDSDNRFRLIEESGLVQHIGDPIAPFPTHQTWYTNQIYCKIGIWKVQ